MTSRPDTPLPTQAPGAAIPVGEADPQPLAPDPLLLLGVQRDLAVALVTCDDPRDCLRVLLDQTLRLPDFDCGGTYFLDEASGTLRLTAHRGLSAAFVVKTAIYRDDTPQSERVQSQTLFYGASDGLHPAIAATLREEGLLAIAVMPLVFDGRLMGSLNLATHRSAEIPAGARIALESIAALVHNAFGAIVARQQRLRTERQFGLAVEGASLGVWQAHPVSRKVSASARARDIHGVAADAPLTIETALAAIHPDDLPLFLAKVREAMAGDGSISVEYRTLAGDRWIRACARYDRRPIPCFHGVVRDATAQKLEDMELERLVEARTRELAAANALLATQSQTLEMALAAADAGVWTLNLATGRTIQDLRTRRLVGDDDRNRTSDLAEAMNDLIHPDFRAEIVRKLAEVASPGGPDLWDHEYQIIHPTSGVRWLNTRGKVIRDATGVGIDLTGIILDVTERKQAEAVLRQWNETLEAQVAGRTRELRRNLTESKRLEAQLQAQRAELERTTGLALISEISQGIIHQLSQPLTNAGNNLEVAICRLDRCAVQDCDSLGVVRESKAEVKRMRDIIVHLRSLAGIRHFKLLPTSLKGLVEELLPLLQREADAVGVHLAADLAETLPDIQGDAVQLKQVIINLVRNALEACAGSEAAGQTTMAAARGSVVIATAPLPDGTVEISVRDTGHGMAPDVIARLFTPFLTTKPGGTGIGLRLCQTIVHAHHGDITGSNNPDGVGACFRVTLPR